jgi:hypothetical protein
MGESRRFSTWKFLTGVSAKTVRQVLESLENEIVQWHQSENQSNLRMLSFCGQNKIQARSFPLSIRRRFPPPYGLISALASRIIL